MSKLFVLVPFMLVASMSYSADFDGGIEKARVPIRVNREETSVNAEGHLMRGGGPNDPEISGTYTILIDETKTVRDLVNSLYDEPSLFEDTKTGNLVQGLAIAQLSYGSSTQNFLYLDPDTVLSTLRIRNGKLSHTLEAEFELIEGARALYRDPARAYYERFSGAYIKGSEE